MKLEAVRRRGVALSTLGVLVVIAMHGLVFFWVPTEASMGVIQRIFYIHVPAAWVGEMAFVIAALCGGLYLWLRDDRLDRAAVSAAEGGMVFLTIVLIVGPLWGRIAWGTYWTWEPRLTFTLLLWFIFLGYFMIRGSAENAETGKRLSAVVAIVGAADIPLIHISVNWFRSLHPEAVVLNPDGPTLDPRMLATLLIGLAGFTILFFGLFLLRYGLEHVRADRQLRAEAS